MSGYDFALNSVEYRLVRGLDQNPRGWSERYVRAALQEQDLSQEASPAFASRSDTRSFYQTNWAGGTRWEIPLLTEQTGDTYNIGRGINAWERPGGLFPVNEVDRTSSLSNIDTSGRMKFITVDGDIYFVGTTQNVDATDQDVYKRAEGADSFAQEAGYTAGQNNSVGIALTYDPDDGTGTFYYLSTDEISWFEPGATTDGSVAASLTPGPGANLFMQDGRLIYYDGNTLTRYSDPSGTPASAAVADDGMGADWLTGMADNATDAIKPKETINLAIGTSDGIFYVKNVLTQGQPQPWVFRVDRDSSGTDISTPIATLPMGTVAVSVGWHLGSLLVMTVDDFAAMYVNDRSTVGLDKIPTALYHVTGGNVGLIGVPENNIPEEVTINESVTAIIGASGPYVYLGGDQYVWVYDAINGGLHRVYGVGLSSPKMGAFHTWAQNQDSSGVTKLLFFGATDTLLETEKALTDNGPLATVASFGTDKTTYFIDSNWFDFDLPFEDKTLTRIFLNAVSTNELTEVRWTLEIGTDDSKTFTERATISPTTAGTDSYAEVDISSANVTGKKFRYKLYFETKSSDESSHFRGLRIDATTGELVRVFELLVDGTESVNVENVPQDPKTILDNLRTLAGNEDHVSFKPNFDEYEQPDDITALQVKVMSVEHLKDVPQEGVYRVVVMVAA